MTIQKLGIEMHKVNNKIAPKIMCELLLNLMQSTEESYIQNM